MQVQHLVDQPPCLAHRSATGGEVDAEDLELVDASPGGERFAIARQHDGSEIAVGFDPLHQGREFGVQFVVEGVHRLGSVQGDNEHVLVESQLQPFGRVIGDSGYGISCGWDSQAVS